ncbi:GNAT family N-acetyltransferase [Tessaracoccus sp. MC1865]|uniref:GNAT family N-acetyltransferase n=1 Tax=Tessaracoccus sp. MC1865 TaxID=2760310 RepID=UPI0016033547|nr:GNAT family N-acetyltransferase [Tessaracoccus sp. MC1865]MBB1482533.1 GNAT family N-acetyltransferase [Tessaracoccus sp. MC1865]QTO38013.1 GNAT family N-acetyltransferase [Tessaracoccus sp. MC1865]
MPVPVLTTPTPNDAEGWFDFLVAQQAATYAGTVPTDFDERQRAYRDEWVPGLEARFANPGSARALVARVGGQIAGIASITDAPARWEVENDLLPAPANRQLDRLYVSSDFHGTGLADALFSNVDDGRPMYLWLINGNERARRFYARRGFVDLDEQFVAGPSWGGVAMHRMLRSMSR